ncbi:MAG: hypothetical protein HUK22_06505, partial [Thermoguttaceae bacterium]|nr:hypothetical protein [Thermoguttaceae bacterium]
ALVEPVGDWKKVRYDYYKTVIELLIERWHRPYGAYCESIGLEYTGHDWEHEWPNAHHSPDNMATAFWRQRPTIDLLMNTFSRGSHSQFGNVRSTRELSSVVRQSGASRSLSENYGAGGHDIRFEDLKRLGDWSYATGVNMTDEHLSYVTIRGARKHDHPQTFSYHSAWFEQYSKLANYWKRLSYLISRGELTDERFLLFEPTTTAWFYQHNAGAESGKLGQISEGFANLLNKLEAAQVDYDLGSEDIAARVGSVVKTDDGPVFRVGAADYRVVVLPNNFENLDVATFDLLVEFVNAGGTVLSLDAALERVGGAAPESLTDEQQSAFKTLAGKIFKTSFEDLVKTAKAAAPVAVVANTNADNVFHMTRQTSDSRIVFVCNIDMTKSAAISIALDDEWKNAGIEKFDPETGEREVVAGCEFELKPCESISFVVSNKIAKADGVKETKSVTINPWDYAKRVKTKALDDNVLVLDYVTLTSRGQTRENQYFYPVNAWLWQQNGYAKSPWDNGVQFKDELLQHKFADDS